MFTLLETHGNLHLHTCSHTISQSSGTRTMHKSMHIQVTSKVRIKHRNEKKHDLYDFIHDMDACAGWGLVYVFQKQLITWELYTKQQSDVRNKQKTTSRGQSWNTSLIREIGGKWPENQKKKSIWESAESEGITDTELSNIFSWKLEKKKAMWVFFSLIFNWSVWVSPSAWFLFLTTRGRPWCSFLLL